MNKDANNTKRDIMVVSHDLQELLLVMLQLVSHDNWCTLVGNATQQWNSVRQRSLWDAAEIFVFFSSDLNNLPININQETVSLNCKSVHSCLSECVWPEERVPG